VAGNDLLTPEGASELGRTEGRGSEGSRQEAQKIIAVVDRVELGEVVTVAAEEQVDVLVAGEEDVVAGFAVDRRWWSLLPPPTRLSM